MQGSLHAPQTTDSMEPQELQSKFKDKLFVTMKEAGIQDQIQKQIRFQIVDKL